MKTMKLLFVLLILGTVATSAQEYATRLVPTDEAETVMVNYPVDVTKETSSAQFHYSVYKKVYEGDFVTGISFKGYNPGKELKRHFKVWVEYGNGKGESMTLVYDDDYVIPSGGTEDSYITLLDFKFDKPYEMKLGAKFSVKMESFGDIVDSPLYFESTTRNSTPISTLYVMSEVKYLKGTVSNQNGNPVVGAEVYLYSNRDDSEYKALTDENGNYSLRIEESNNVYPVTVSATDCATFVGKSDASTVRLKDAASESVRDFVLFDKIAYTKDQRATIILPVAPNPEWGSYFRLDRRENNDVIFEYESAPQANVPYVIFPYEDFELNVGDYDLQQEPGSIVVPYPDERDYPVPFAAIYGSYENTDILYTYTDQHTRFLDLTPDCDTKDEPFMGRIGACRAYMRLISPGLADLGMAFPNYVFSRNPTGITEKHAISNSDVPFRDLQGRQLTQQPRKGVYIRDGRKVVVK